MRPRFEDFGFRVWALFGWSSNLFGIFTQFYGRGGFVFSHFWTSMHALKTLHLHPFSINARRVNTHYRYIIGIDLPKIEVHLNDKNKTLKEYDAFSL